MERKKNEIFDQIKVSSMNGEESAHREHREQGKAVITFKLTSDLFQSFHQIFFRLIKLKLIELRRFRIYKLSEVISLQFDS